VPNGGDFPPRCASSRPWTPRGVVTAAAAAKLCGDPNVARAEQDVHPKEQAEGYAAKEERALIERYSAAAMDLWPP
jgi:hypothetical protein